MSVVEENLRREMARGARERIAKREGMRRRVRAHLRDVRMFKTLGFRYDSARGGRFVIDEEEFFEVASA